MTDRCGFLTGGSFFFIVNLAARRWVSRSAQPVLRVDSFMIRSTRAPAADTP
jgi:hypothetical protein